MKKILGYIQGNMKKEAIETIDRDVGIINSLSNPPLVPVKKEDIFVRRCRLASNAVDCSYGKFRTEDLPGLLEFIQGVSMLIGHKKDTVGIARFFNGNIEQIEDVYNPFIKKKERITYIVPKFYWMKKHSKAEDLQVNIDGGIYNQVSLSWWYNKATCGICGKDMRECEHIPGRKYGSITAFYYYDEIGEVLEGSIVYKGGQPYTGFYLDNELSEGINESRKIFNYSYSKSESGSRVFKEDIINYLKPLKRKAYITGDLANKGYSDDKIDIEIETADKDDIIDLLPLPFKNKINFIKRDKENIEGLSIGNINVDETSESEETVIPIRNISNEYFLKKDFIKFTGMYIIEPLYQGIPVQIIKNDRKVIALDPFKKDISGKIPHIIEDFKSFNEKNLILDGILLAYHGRTRRTHKEVCDVVYGNKKSKDLRLKLKVFDFLKCGNLDSTDTPLIDRNKILSEVIYDTKNVQIIKSQLTERPTEIISNINKYSTKDGAIVKEAFGKYSETDKWFKYKKRFEIDTKIIDCKITDNSTEYVCGIICENELKIIGCVCSEKINPEKGNIVRLEVEKVEITGDEIKLVSPKIVGIRYDKNKPDDVSIIKKISETNRDTDDSSDTLCEFMAYEYDEGNESFFELLVQNNSNTGFMKFNDKGDSLKKLFSVRNESALSKKKNCTSLTKRKDSYGCIPSNCRILDYGYIFNLKDSKHLKKFSLYGKYGVVHGNFIAREIMYKGENLFLLWKVNF